MEEFIVFVQEYFAYILIIGVFLFVLGGILYANTTIDHYVATFKRMNNTAVRFGGTGIEFAQIINQVFFGGSITVKVVEKEKINSNGQYSTADQSVTLAEDVANRASIASVAIIAHEFGHAFQHYHTPQILIKNFKLMRAVKFLGILNYPLIILAVALFFYHEPIIAIICLGAVFISFFIALCLKLSVVRLEKDASDKALKILKKLRYFSSQELKQIHKFLNLAKGTYKADFYRALFAWTGLTRKTNLF